MDYFVYLVEKVLWKNLKCIIFFVLIVIYLFILCVGIGYVVYFVFFVIVEVFCELGIRLECLMLIVVIVF